MRRVNVNFLLSMVVIAAILFFAVSLGLVINSTPQELLGIESEMDELRGENGVEDVEGYALIGHGLAYALGTVGAIVILVVAICIGIYAVLLFIFALIARIVFAKSGKGLLAYRILMGIEYFLQVLLELALIGSGVVSPILIVLLAGIIIYSARNTYSSRIYASE